MRKKISLLLAAALVFGCAASGCTATRVVNVYNRDNYIDESIFDTFTEQTGIVVIYTTFETNEDLYSALKSGDAGYDVIFPSDYMISRMITEDMLEALDFDNIPNFDNIDPEYKNLEYDPTNEYSVPYAWGTIGIIYNTTIVNEPVSSWDILFDEEYGGRILMLDNPRDSIGIALKYLGYSYNSTEAAEITEAADLLIAQKPLVQEYVTDRMFDKMTSGEAAVGPCYAGDAVTMMQANSDLAFVIPSEGSNMFVDCMCIPTGASNKEGAEAFINFMCQTDIALSNCGAASYSTPCIGAYEALEEAVKNNRIIYPDESTLENCGTYTVLPDDIIELYDDLWTKLKAS